MKQKYNITVADMELSIISDASPDEVESIVGMLDRRIRDIKLKSPRCTKNEAAILCALAYCSERIAMQEAFKKVEKDAFRFAGENEKLKKTIESLQDELENLRKDAAVMRSILDRATLTATVPATPVAPAPAAPAAEVTPTAPVAAPVTENETAAAPVEAPVIPTAPVPPSVGSSEDAPAAAGEEAAMPTPKKGNKPSTPGKSRVGSMFDLLTFSDV